VITLIEHVFTLCEVYGEAPGADGSGREGGFMLKPFPELFNMSAHSSGRRSDSTVQPRGGRLDA